MVTIVNVDPTRAPRRIADTDQVAEYGVPVEVDAELAERLLAQTDVWARPNSKAAKAAKDGDA